MKNMLKQGNEIVAIKYDNDTERSTFTKINIKMFCLCSNNVYFKCKREKY